MSMTSCLHRSGLGRLAVPELGRAGPKPSNCPKNGPQLSALGKKQASLNPPRNQKSPQNTNIGHFRTFFQKILAFWPERFSAGPSRKEQAGGCCCGCGCAGPKSKLAASAQSENPFFKKKMELATLTFGLQAVSAVIWIQPS